MAIRVSTLDSVQKNVEPEDVAPEDATRSVKQRVRLACNSSQVPRQVSRPLVWVIITSVFFTLSPVALWFVANSLIAPSRLPASPAQIVLPL